MPFEKHGFLGQQARENTENIRKRHDRLFNLVDEVNEYTHEAIVEVNIDPQDMHQCLVGSLFAKMVQSFQALVILAQYGLESDSNIILRALFDDIFLFGSIIEDKEFAERYIEHERVLQLKLTNAAINNAKDLRFGKKMMRRLTDRKAELEKEIKAAKDDKKGKRPPGDDKMFSSERLAKKAGLNAMYQSGYRILSNDVHTSPVSVEAFLNIENGQRIKSIRLGPRVDSITKNLCVGMSILLQALGRRVCINRNR